MWRDSGSLQNSGYFCAVITKMTHFLEIRPNFHVKSILSANNPSKLASGQQNARGW
ncbi:hypothetical protein RISK_003762 [Rhodopirellula islandica]|uniref:Uncharacterized protein n=1 Tax=Rhodopirellula islandica TaxID=595434 RepID=A0A0J1BCE0_RHOIS|nr:hypothetical protein RISK_003762 [Rhodopirellula islandica]